MTLHEIGQHPWRNWKSADRTVQHIIRHVAETEGGARKLTVGEKEYTAADLADMASRVAATLRGYGAGDGDRVVVISPNRSEIVDLFYGSAWNGSVLVPLNPGLRGDPLRHQLRMSEPTIVLFDRSTRDQLDDALDIFDGLDLPVLLEIESPSIDGASDAIADAPAVRVAGAEPFEPASLGREPVEIGPGTTLAILFTSGTTGPAKGVVMPHGQFWWWAVVACEQLALNEDDVLYTSLPLFHTNALTTPLQAFAAGARAVIGPKFSVSAFWSRLEAAQATTTFVLGAMTTMLWNRRPSEFDRDQTAGIRKIHAPGIDAGLRPEFEEYFGVALVEGFGMTEVGVPFYTPVGEATAGVCGIVHPDYEAAIVDTDANMLDDGVAGELVLRPRQPWLIAQGYFHNAEETVNAWRNLWFHTGDLFIRDSRGVYKWLDRMKDSIRRRGENISSYDVEMAFRKHPAVMDAAAIAVPSPLGEDEVMVCVVARSGRALEPMELIDFAARDLPAFALPTYVRVLDALPQTANGKVSKHGLRLAGITDDTWERPAIRA